MPKINNYREINFNKLIDIFNDKKVKYYLYNDEHENYVLYNDDDIDIEWGLTMYVMDQTIKGAKYSNFRDAINECIEMNCLHSSNGFDAKVYIEPDVVEIEDYIIEDVIDLMEAVDDYMDTSDLDELLFI